MAAEAKIPQVERALKEPSAMETQLQADVKQAQSDRAEAKAAIAKATFGEGDCRRVVPFLVC